ncbi:hypothetical protein XU18_0850 [Perkinsela sp. CCAP 1560/4]|nr:hypothetical protein XU18_0850 [Perkinsela sp. CCAP 1560/4]|eukprot:KNH08653.1 hypothetical protein XU18_0850 [Perkinsela sp. CCAP 1560/4]
MLKAVKSKAKDESESIQHILHPDWKAQIAELVIGSASFRETASNAPVGCQKHSPQAQLLADPSCAASFRSGLHKVSSDIFNHFFMFRCMKNLEVSQSNATTEIQDTEQSVIAQDYPNLVQALQSSQIIRQSPLNIR